MNRLPRGLNPHGIRTAASILVLSIAAASLLAQAQTAPLRLVSTAWPPFTNDAGKPRFALDLVEAALGRIGFRAQTVIVDAARFTPSLLSSEFDGSAAAWKDEERERAVIFSQPYLENRLVLVGRRDADVSSATLGALKGKRIALVGGYSYGGAIESAGPTFVRSQSEEDSLKLLLGSGVDYTLMDELVVQYIIDNHAQEAKARLAIGSTPLITRQLHFVVRRSRPDAESIIRRFNEQLRTMVADRTYHRLLHVSWIRADVDGDGRPEYVPASDRSGPSEPSRAYLLFNDPALKAREGQKRYYFGGNIYAEWANVPEQFKGYDSQRPDPARSTGTIFRFSW